MEWRSRIVSNPDILMGKPVIKGTRISVELITSDPEFESGYFITLDGTKIRRCALPSVV